MPPCRRISFFLLAAAVMFAPMGLVLARDERAPEQEVSILGTREDAGTSVSAGEILDATQTNSLKPEVGQRYRVRLLGESPDGAWMLARIGETLTYVRGGTSGEVVEVEVTRVYRTTADAKILSLETSIPPDTAISPARKPSSVEPTVSITEPQEVYTGVVERLGSKGDGLVYVEGTPVYISGAQPGERVVFEITSKRERYWTGKLLRRIWAEEPGRTRPSEARPWRAPRVVEGAEFEVVVSEREIRNPDKNGVARIDGLAVIVPDSRPGDRVRIRIVERRPTLARSEIIERLPQEAK